MTDFDKRDFRKVKLIGTLGGYVDIELNDKQLKGITKVGLNIEAGEFPKLILEMNVFDVEILDINSHVGFVAKYNGHYYQMTPIEDDVYDLFKMKSIQDDKNIFPLNGE